MMAYVAERCRTQQGITQGVQGNITIGMGRQCLIMRYSHTTQHHVIAFAKSVNIDTLADPDFH